MADPHPSSSTNFKLPRRQFLGQDSYIAAPSHASFVSRFGHAFPEPKFLESDLGVTAVYDLAPPSGQSKRPVMIIHGINTPALGMWPFAKELQRLDPDAHIVLFDLWGHGLSSTPLVAHTPQTFHSQIFQVLSFKGWSAAHLIGYSFGGITLISFGSQNPQAVLSAALVGPAGLLRFRNFDERMQQLLLGSSDNDDEAIETVLAWLEGGPLIVPSDWQERAKAGEVVAEALREWERQEHSGYQHSVLSMFRYGGVHGQEEKFRKFAEVVRKHIGILGALDEVCSEDDLVKLGLENVEVVPEANHDFVRTRYQEVARIVHQFWQQQD